MRRPAAFCFMTSIVGLRSQAAVAFRDSIPVMMGYLPLGFVFGFLFVQAGASAWMAPLCSIIVYGGASQYMMVPMVAAGASIPAIAFATLVINLRHIFYGVSLLQKVPSKGLARWYIAYTLTDETYSLLSIMPVGTPLARMLLVCFFNHLWWILGGLIGAVAGANVTIGLSGLDFVLTSLFAMLTAEQWRNRKTALSLWAALASYAAARLAVPENALAVSIAFCAAAGLFWGMRRDRQGGKAPLKETEA